MAQENANANNLFTIAFYNLENLFDTENDPLTLDDDFTQDAPKSGQRNGYKKIKKLSRVISNIGYKETGHPPVLIGVAEVENSFVLDLLTQSKFLKDKNYGYVHFDSPDERGIDNALLYRKDYFKVVKKQVHELLVTNELGERDYTRDILHVEGILYGQPLHLLVNHWPSRRMGTEETAFKRIIAAEKNLEIIERVLDKNPEARCVVMGDFNDNPQSKSVQILTDTLLYNPMEVLLSLQDGSLSHDDEWLLFDQIMFSPIFLKGHENPFRFQQAQIYKPPSIQEYKGRYKGLPFRTYVGKKYLGGYSDHFPVFTTFSISSTSF